jgi:hypothetical protein
MIFPPSTEISLQATPASHLRYQIAHILAELCPVALGQEIIVTGSVSKGLADEFSDIELVFYVSELPGILERDTWLRQIGAADIIHDEDSIADASIWSTFRFRDIWIEAGWQTFRTHEDLLQRILAGQVLDHSRLILAEITARALPLRSEGVLARWQQELVQYPSVLAPKLIFEATDMWRFPHLLTSRWASVARNDPLKLTGVLVSEVQRLLRVLFAANQQWEPEWKWISSITSTLAYQPDDLLERIEIICTEKDLAQRVRVCFQLIYDVLSLLPPEYDCTQARNTMLASLDLHR